MDINLTIGSNLCLINGNIYTFDAINTNVNSVIIQNGLIKDVDIDQQLIVQYKNNMQVIDLKGKTVFPGFIDCHVHLISCGTTINQLDLKTVTSINDICNLVKNEAEKKPQGTWILGRGYDDSILSDKRIPNRWDLDKVAPNHPVLLIRIGTHVISVNSKALELANITKDTSSPSGGQIDKEPESNEPTGILRETATSLVRNLVVLSDNEYQTAIKATSKIALSKGITSIHCFPELDLIQAPQWRAFQQLSMRNELQLRIYHLIDVSLLPKLTELGLSTGFGNTFLKFGAIKIFQDGSLGARTAAMIKPYNDASNTQGLLIYPEDQFYEKVKAAHIAGFQIAIHCIGDKANIMALDAIEAAISEFPRANHRHRIEHASVLNPEIIQKMNKLEIIASVQPPFIYSDYWVSERVGTERAKYVYPFKTMLDAGIKIAASSDSPTEMMDPLAGIQSAVTRITRKGDVFNPDQKISLEAAIRMYTTDAAYASFEEHLKGSIEPSKLADLVILSDDPFQVPAHKISEIEIDKTIVGGKIIYSKE